MGYANSTEANQKKFREVNSEKEANSRTSAAAPNIHIRRLGTFPGTQTSSESTVRFCCYAGKQYSGTRETDMKLPELGIVIPRLSPAELQ